MAWFTKEQIRFMQEMNIPVADYDNPTDDEFATIFDMIGDRLMYSGLDEDYAPNEIGDMCYSILNDLP